jgi:exodeoxyribonuclease VII large subunit
MARRLGERQSALAAAAGRLNALSPLATLERGYAVARGEQGMTLASASQFAEGQLFTLRLRDGEVDATTRVVRTLPEHRR